MEALNHVRRATSATSAHVNTVTMLLAFLVHDQSGVLVNAQQTPGCGSNPPASGKKVSVSDAQTDDRSTPCFVSLLLL